MLVYVVPQAAHGLARLWAHVAGVGDVRHMPGLNVILQVELSEEHVITFGTHPLRTLSRVTKINDKKQIHFFHN